MGILSSLARYALAGFYHQTGRDAQAIELYNGLIAKPTTAVPAYTAQLALADLYSTAGKTEQAKQIWAKVKDADKAGAAGSIAAGEAERQEVASWRRRSRSFASTQDDKRSFCQLSWLIRLAVLRSPAISP
jgi:tetratricopeptide (TPR) repeat protein